MPWARWLSANCSSCASPPHSFRHSSSTWGCASAHFVRSSARWPIAVAHDHIEERHQQARMPAAELQHRRFLIRGHRMAPPSSKLGDDPLRVGPRVGLEAQDRSARSTRKSLRCPRDSASARGDRASSGRSRRCSGRRRAGRAGWPGRRAAAFCTPRRTRRR